MIGRPTVIDEEVVTLLVQSFHDGLNILQACHQSGISRKVYYERLKVDEDFGDIMETAQGYGTELARRNIQAALKAKDKDISKWYLERKDKEFKPKQDLTSDDKPIPLLAGIAPDGLEIANADTPEDDSPQQDQPAQETA